MKTLNAIGKIVSENISQEKIPENPEKIHRNLTEKKSFDKKNRPKTASNLSENIRKRESRPQSARERERDSSLEKDKMRDSSRERERSSLLPNVEKGGKNDKNGGKSPAHSKIKTLFSNIHKAVIACNLFGVIKLSHSLSQLSLSISKYIHI